MSKNKKTKSQKDEFVRQTKKIITYVLSESKSSFDEPIIITRVVPKDNFIAFYFEDGMSSNMTLGESETIVNSAINAFLHVIREEVNAVIINPLPLIMYDPNNGGGIIGINYGTDKQLLGE